MNQQHANASELRAEHSASKKYQTIKLGLDVHLEFIMAVAQKDHANPHAPRKFTRPELVAQVRQWVAETLAQFKVPTYVELSGDKLPRNASGKLLKNVLRGEGEVSFSETM